MANLADRTFFEQDLHDIKTHLNGWILQKVQIIQTTSGKPPTPHCIHSRRRPVPSFRGSGFHLNKNEAIRIPEHQIDFASRRPKISGQEFEPPFLKKTFGLALAELPVKKVQRRAGPVKPMIDTLEKSP
jgi:hypothetical protein